MHKKALIVLTISFLCLTLTAENKWPKYFSASCGALSIRFDAKNAYTMGAIIFKGNTLCSDLNGAFYGTVFCFPGMKFIGSGHTENETENVEHIEIIADGKTIDPATVKDGDVIKAEKFIFTKKSKVKDFSFRNITELDVSSIKQKAIITAGAETQLHLFYNFMMPWSTEMNSYLAEDSNGQKEEGAFVSDNKFLLNKEMNWVALYSEKFKAGTITFIGECSSVNPSVVMLWDRNVYHKFYLRSFLQKPFPKDFEAVYDLKTVFFESEKDSWHDCVSGLAVKK